MGVDEQTLVLVVDDDEFVRKALGRNLRRLGCEVLVAADGDEGMRVATESAPAVIYLDLRMPGMDGHTVLRHLEETGVRSSVVAMSAQGDMDDVIEAVRRGAVDYVKKPWSNHDLVLTLARGVQVFREREEQTSVPAAPPGPSAFSGTGRPALPGTLTAVIDPPPPSPPLRDIAEWLRSGDIPVPEPSPALTRLRQMPRSPDPAIDDLVPMIEADKNLTITLLRLANSALYPGASPAADVRAAVTRVGVRQIHGLAETVGLRDGYQVRTPAAQRLQERLWRFSVARGVAMRAIAGVTAPDMGLDGDRCYLAGLLLDVGASFLLWTMAERAPDHEADGTIFGNAMGVNTTGGNTVVGMAAYHEAFSQALLARWAMPDEIVALAGEHHVATSPSSQTPLWCAAVTAGSLAARLAGGDITHPQGTRSEVLARCAQTLGLGETVLRRLAIALQDDVREVWAVYA